MSAEIIKQLKYEDEGSIINLILKSLQNNDEICAIPILPTKRNAINYYNSEIFPIIFDEDPALGLFKGKKLIAISLCSTKLDRTYDTEIKIAAGSIDIVDPEFRRRGISSKLRTKILHVLRSKGYNEVYLNIKKANKASLDCASKVINSVSGNQEEISTYYSYKI
jgi:GNAT superfamily N-acetyltransferase